MTPPNNPIPLEEAVERVRKIIAPWPDDEECNAQHVLCAVGDLRTIIDALPDEEMVADAVERINGVAWWLERNRADDENVQLCVADLKAQAEAISTLCVGGK
jgi:hypothetical protein